METPMSAFITKIHQLLDEAKAEFEKLIGHGDAEVQAVAKTATEKIDAVKAVVEADAVPLEHEAVADAEKVAADAETVAKPVIAEAVKAAEGVASEAVADIAKSA
jgi:CRISPR/Cas system-associated exonuclease Cas4 (RecB family)